MKYKIAVCDDEKIFAEDVAAKIRACGGECEITLFDSGENLLDSSLDFNMIFLDIEMAGLDGISSAFALRERNYDGIIIFLTSHTEFMPDAFKVNAFRFLSKPVDVEKFSEAFAAAKKLILNTDHIFIDGEKETAYLKLTDVVCLEAYGDGTYIYDKNGQVYNTAKSLKYWSGRIGGEHFFRIHKSFVVSLLYVAEITGDFKVSMRNFSRSLPVSRRNYMPLKNAFFDYIRKYARVL